MEIVSFAQIGYDGEIVKVEADLRRGIPAIDVVGLPDGAVRESRERMRAAIRNSGLEFPRERILLNLSPASLKKEGSAFDLPIALAVLGSAEGLVGNQNGEGQVMVLGELELSGTVRAVPGVLAAVAAGSREGIRRFIVPSGNEAEARLVREARVSAVGTLLEAIAILRSLGTGGSMPEGEDDDRPEFADAPEGSFGGRGQGSFNKKPQWQFPEPGDAPGYEDIRGQRALVRALQIAAAGGHNLIVYGPPGCGKTMALRRFTTLLPDLNVNTALEVTRIHSIADMLPRNGPALLHRPPFREPHPNASLEGLIGGGTRSKPGEISLAHGGALFLDEAAHFRASALQALRSPLESGEVTLSRAGRAVTFPSRFQLLVAVNPCPCGNAGAPGRVCTCMPEAVERYWKRLTAPLLDRIDLRVEVRPPAGEELSGTAIHSTAKLREGIKRAKETQWERNGGVPNAWLNPERLAESARLTAEARKDFAEAMRRESLSGRGGHALLRVARTIADLEGSPAVEREHLTEAVGYRKWGIAVPDFL